MLRRDVRVATSGVTTEKFGRDIRRGRHLECLLIENYFSGLSIYDLCHSVDDA